MNIERWVECGANALAEEFGPARVERAVRLVSAFAVEIPSWALGPFGGGRFGEYTPPGAARNAREKLDDAALINRLTGAAPRVAAHVLWDFSRDGMTPDERCAEEFAAAAAERGLGLGAVNPTYFLRGSHRGSFTSDDPARRRAYLEQTLFAGSAAARLGTGLVTLWFPDGSFYPGQIDLGEAFGAMRDTLAEARRRLPEAVEILMEYKLFEPGTYSTTIPDWGTALVLARRAGGRTGVLVDLGHHAHGVNVEQIVAVLIAEGVPGGFHFNTRYSADDDHAVEPGPQMSRIFHRLVAGGVLGGEGGPSWSFMIDQCSGRENRIQATIHSVDSLQIALARAALVDEAALAGLRARDEIVLANRLFNDPTMNADVRPLVVRSRMERNLPPDPVRAYVESGYQRTIEDARR